MKQGSPQSKMSFIVLCIIEKKMYFVQQEIKLWLTISDKVVPKKNNKTAEYWPYNNY
jgi:hypothetical protein